MKIKICKINYGDEKQLRLCRSMPQHPTACRSMPQHPTACRSMPEMQKEEGRRQKAEGRRKKAECRRKKKEGRVQKGITGTHNALL